MTLAPPNDWIHLRSSNSQYAEIGMRASPTEEKVRMDRQTSVIHRRPYRSDSGPHIIGAGEQSDGLRIKSCKQGLSN